MQIIYELIFGKTWGGGHFSRAVRLIEMSKMEVDLHIHFQNKGDQKFLFRSAKYRVGSFEKHYDLHIIDTLGLFVSDYISDEKIMLDDIHSNYAEDDDFKYEHLLYPCEGSSDYRYKKLLYPTPQKNIGIIQGSGDDYNQIIEISKQIPEKYHQIIFATENCRHLENLKNWARDKVNIDVLINCNFTQYIHGLDLVVSSGGNTLLEILNSSAETKIILFSKEKKEHQTMNLFYKNSKIIKVFDIEEPFYWREHFDPAS